MKKHYIAAITLGFVSFGIILLISRLEQFRLMELKFLDYRYDLRKSHSVDPNIVITAIDDNSIQQIGRWPWSRNIHAAILKAFSEFPPKVIGFDVLFAEEEDGKGDANLAYFTKLLGNVVHAGYINVTDNKITMPIQELLYAGYYGLINAAPDKDGIIRKIPLVIKDEQEYHPSFVLRILCKYLDIEIKDIDIRYGRHILIPNIGKVPIDKNGCMWINYVGDQHIFKEVAFHQMLVWPNMREFSGKLVLVGITSTGIGDQGNIPIATNVPLITVHANALNTLLKKDFIDKVTESKHLVILIICVLISVLINMIFRPIRAGLSTLLLAILYIGISIWLFQNNIWINILAPTLGIILPFVSITIYRYGWEEKQKRWIKKAFTHYLSKDVIEAIIKQPDKLKLGGELKTATVLYADLRNFSTYCEGRSPHEVVCMLNSCFDWMTDIILNNGGMLDKYIGDAIMAIFGAPIDLPLELQAAKAVKAALAIIEKWRSLPENKRCNSDVTIGVNTGPMLIGNMGSQHIFNYTAIGDEVNIASRVQGLTKDYNAKIIITDSVNNLIKGKFRTELLGEVKVKGRKGNVIIYKVERSVA